MLPLSNLLFQLKIASLIYSYESLISELDDVIMQWRMIAAKQWKFRYSQMPPEYDTPASKVGGA